MKILKIDLKKVKKEEIDIVADYFLKGKIVVCPTDTVYGIGCAADNAGAVEKIYKIKKRPKNKPFIILADSSNSLKKYAYLSKKQQEYLKKMRKGGDAAASAVLKAGNVLPEALKNEDGSVAVRVPAAGKHLQKNDFITKILKKIKIPIVSTSLNITGKKAIDDPAKIGKNFGSGKFDLIVDAGEIKARPSTVIDLRDIKKVKVLRK